MSIGLGILLGCIAIAIVILYVATRKTPENFKKIFSGLTIVFAISAILLIAAVWYLNNTKISVEVKGVNPSGMLRHFNFRLPGSIDKLDLTTHI